MITSSSSSKTTSTCPSSSSADFPVPNSASKNYPFPEKILERDQQQHQYNAPFERILPASYPMHHLSKFALAVEDRNHMCIECALVMLDNSHEQATTLGAAVSRIHAQLSQVAYNQMVLRYPLFGSVPNNELTEFVAVPVDMDEHIRHVVCGEVYQDRHALLDAQDDNQGTLKHYLQEVMNSNVPLVHNNASASSNLEEDKDKQHVQLEQFNKTVSSWLNVPFRSHVPLWEIIVIHNYSQGLGLLFRIHHCLGDGTTLANVFKDLCENVPLLENPQLQVLKKSKRKENVKNVKNEQSASLVSQNPQEPSIEHVKNVSEILHWIIFQVFVKHLWSNIQFISKHVFSLLKTIIMLFITSVTWSVDMLLGKDMDSVIKTGRSSTERVIAWTGSISLEDATRISKTFGVTINDLLISCFSAGIQRYIDGHHHRYVEQYNQQLQEEEWKRKEEEERSRSRRNSRSSSGKMNQQQMRFLGSSEEFMEEGKAALRLMRNVVIDHSKYFNLYSNAKKKPTHFRISIPVNIRSDPFKVNVFEPNEIGFMISTIPLFKNQLPRAESSAVATRTLSGSSSSISEGSSGSSSSMCSNHDLIAAKLRLKQVQKSMNWAKGLAQPLLSNLISAASQYFPPWFIHSVFSYCASFNSVAFTNVRGTPSQLYLLSYPVTDMIGFNPSPVGIELSCLLMSYHGKISFSVVSDKENIKDPEELLKYVLEEFQVLKNGAAK